MVSKNDEARNEDKKDEDRDENSQDVQVLLLAEALEGQDRDGEQPEEDRDHHEGDQTGFGQDTLIHVWPVFDVTKVD